MKPEDMKIGVTETCVLCGHNPDEKLAENPAWFKSMLGMSKEQFEHGRTISDERKRNALQKAQPLIAEAWMLLDTKGYQRLGSVMWRLADALGELAEVAWKGESAMPDNPTGFGWFICNEKWDTKEMSDP